MGTSVAQGTLGMMLIGQGQSLRRRMALRAGALMLALLLSHSQALAQGIERFGAFSVDTARPDAIRLLDYIDDSAVVDFRRALTTFPNLTTIILDSPGGLVNNALVIADIAFERGMSTVVPQQAQCFSACVYIFLAGHSRLALGQLGVHQMSADNDLPDARVQETLANVMEALNKFGTPFEIIALMLRTNADDIRVLTARELRDWGVNRDATALAEVNRPATVPPAHDLPANADAPRTTAPADRPAPTLAILYEEGAPGAATPALEATIAWRLVNDPAGPIIAATIEVPERHMSIAFSIQENHNAALAFSHEIDFLVTADRNYTPPAGGVASIAQLAVKTTEDAIGQPLVGESYALPPDFFWIELDPAAESENLTRLRSLEWFDLGIVYANGQRAILTFQKGLDGQQVFQEAFAAWAAAPPGAIAAPAITPRDTPAANTIAPAGWYVQLASQTSERAARADILAFRSRVPLLLGPLGAVIPTAMVGGVVRYRVQFGPTAGQSEAMSLCGSLRAAGIDCVVAYNSLSSPAAPAVDAPLPEAPAITLAFEDVGNPILLAVANGDAAAGEQVAMQCAGCHSLGEGEAHRFGPNLYGVVYGPVGGKEGFTYSPAFATLHDQGAIWTYAGLDAFLANPQAAVPGTTMPFGGIADATDRANLIAYVRTLAAEPVPVALPEALQPTAHHYYLTTATSTVSESAGRFLIQLNRASATVAETVTVSVRPDGTNSGLGDIAAFQGAPFMFPAGQLTRTIQIALIDDNLREQDEAFLVEAFHNGILVAGSRFTIFDDDRVLSAADIAELARTLRDAVARCWNPPPGWTNPAEVRVVLQFRLNRDGTVQGLPQIVEAPTGRYAQAAPDSAQRAVYVCAPYQLPAELYDGPNGWHEVRMTFDPREMF